MSCFAEKLHFFVKRNFRTEHEIYTNVVKKGKGKKI